MTSPWRLKFVDLYELAMQVTDQAGADAHFEKLVEYRMSILGCDRIKAEQMERSNLGYYAGYFDNETRARVEALYHCEHPIFGSIAKKGPPTNEEAFRLGVEMASLFKNKGGSA